MENEAPPLSVVSGLLRRFDVAHGELCAVLSELIASGKVTPVEFLDALGIETLERYLPSLLRVRLMRMALQEGRAGRPFDDEAMLGVISPELLASHLPPAVLREALGKLCVEAGDPEDLQPLSESDEVGTTHVIESLDEGDEALDESDEVTVAIGAEETDALLAQMPDLTLIDTKR